MLTSLLQALGVDGTFFIQFACFLIFYPLLSRGLFRPYFQLQNQREDETVKCMEQVENLKVGQENLKEEYAQKARELNEKFNQLYSEKGRALRKESLKRRAADQARLAKEYEEKSLALFKESSAAEASLQSEVPSITKTAVEHLVS